MKEKEKEQMSNKVLLRIKIKEKNRSHEMIKVNILIFVLPPIDKKTKTIRLNQYIMLNIRQAYSLISILKL